jgi:hypothetical protein
MDNEYNRNSNGTRAMNWEEVYNLIESRWSYGWENNHWW